MSRALPRLLALLLTVSGCGSGRRSEPLVGPIVPTTPEQRRGELVFFAHCHKCHPGGDAGLGPATNNKPLPDAAIRLQVRSGAGAMPAFSSERIGDADLDALVSYMKLLRRAD